MQVQSAGLECVMIATRNGFRGSGDFQEIAVLTLFFFFFVSVYTTNPHTSFYLMCFTKRRGLWLKFYDSMAIAVGIDSVISIFSKHSAESFSSPSLSHYNAGHRQPLRLSSGKCVLVAALTQLSPRRITKFITQCRDSTVDNSSCFCWDWDSRRRTWEHSSRLFASPISEWFPV